LAPKMPPHKGKMSDWDIAYIATYLYSRTPANRWWEH
jgi:hypothetical protein